MDSAIIPHLCDVIEQFLGQTLTPEVGSRVVASAAARCYPGPVDTSAIAPQTVGSYQLRCDTLAATVDRLRGIHRLHWAETEKHHHKIAFNPDYARALDLEQQGRYVLIVAQHRDTGLLVGNYSLYLSRSMHTQTLMATEDSLFIAREHRRGRLGVAMIRYGEAVLRQLGVEELNVSVKLVNGVGSMIERMGYTPVGTQYTKLLKEPTHVLT